jgi:hypothetical protein
MAPTRGAGLFRFFAVMTCLRRSSVHNRKGPAQQACGPRAGLKGPARVDAITVIGRREIFSSYVE